MLSLGQKPVADDCPSAVVSDPKILILDEATSQ